MEKRGVRISKTLVKAQLLALAAVILTAVVSHLIVLKVPSSPFAKINDFQILNQHNAAVVYSDYFQKQSILASKQDWMIFTPLSLLIGGLVYGSVIGLKRNLTYVTKAAIGSGLFFSLLILGLSFAGNLVEDTIAQNGGYTIPPQILDWQYLGMGVVQAVYWTAVYVAATLAGGFIRQTAESSGADRKAGPAVTAAPGK